MTSQCDTDTSELDPRSNRDFAVIYDKTSSLLLFVAAQLGMAQDEREDVAQQAYLRLVESKATYTLAHAKAYLICAVRSIVIDRSRRAAVRKTDVREDWSAIEGRGLWESDQEHEVALSALGKALERCARDPAAAILAWFYRDGLSIQEIKERTGDATGTVTAKLCRLRKKYAAQLRDDVEAALGALIG